MARKVLVARGREWALYWPRDEWEKLTTAEQQAVRDRQAALLEDTGGDGRYRPRPAAVRPGRAALVQPPG